MKSILLLVAVSLALGASPVTAAPCALTGSVAGPKGPLDDVKVTLRTQEEYTTVDVRWIDTVQNGHFDLGPIGKGWYRVSVEVDGFVPFTKAIRCDGQGKRKKVDIKLKRGDRRIGGLVIDEDGVPLAGAEVTIVQVGEDKDKHFKVAAFVEIDELGRFWFHVPSQASSGYVIYANAPGHQFASVDMQADAIDLERELAFKLKREAWVAGVVLDPQGHPAPKAKITQGGPWSMVGSDADGKGKFEMGVRPGKPIIIGARLGKLVGWTQPVVVNKEQAADVVVKLRPGRTIRGTVVDGDSKRVSLAEVFVVSRRTGIFNRVQADLSGRFVAVGLPRGEPLLAWATGGRLRQKKVQTGEADATVDLVLLAP